MKEWRKQTFGIFLVVLLCAYSMTSFPVTGSTGCELDIDIKPGSDPNSINIGSNEVISVAVFGSSSFNVKDIDADTVTFGPDNAMEIHKSQIHYEYVNDDEYLDAVFHFQQADTGISADDEYAVLNCETDDGESLSGCDEVKVISNDEDEYKENNLTKSLFNEINKLRKIYGEENITEKEFQRFLKLMKEMMEKSGFLFEGPLTPEDTEKMKEFVRAYERVYEALLRMLGKAAKALEDAEFNEHRFLINLFKTIADGLKRHRIIKIGTNFTEDGEARIFIDLRDPKYFLKFEFLTGPFGIIGISIEIRDDTVINITKTREGKKIEFKPGTVRIDFDDLSFFGIHIAGPCLPEDIWIDLILVLEDGTVIMIGSLDQDGTQKVKYIFNNGWVKVLEWDEGTGDYKQTKEWNIRDCSKKKPE